MHGSRQVCIALRAWLRQRYFDQVRALGAEDSVGKASSMHAHHHILSLFDETCLYVYMSICIYVYMYI